MIRNACPDLVLYAQNRLGSWHDLVAAATHVRSMMGITGDTWEEAKRVMGAENAATTLAAMLQKFAKIKSPGAYLRSLSARAGAGNFTPRPMILTLLREAQS